MIFALLLAATLTFTDTSGIEEGFLVQITTQDKHVRFQDFPGGSPGTGTVVFKVPEGDGFCFAVSSYGAGGMLAQTNRVCLGAPVPKPSATPTGLAVTP